MRRAAPLAAVLAAVGCAAPRSYMGVDLVRPATGAAAKAQGLATRARTGDAAAQLALGRMFEEGTGVPADLDRACRLYRNAAATTGGTIYVYSPKVGNSPGRVIPISTPVRPGIAEAGERRANLAYRASAGDRARSRCLAMAP